MTVTGTEVIWEAPDAYVRVTFVISEQGGCYRRGREEAAVGATRTSTRMDSGLRLSDELPPGLDTGTQHRAAHS